jgi:hypothetical protein
MVTAKTILLRLLRAFRDAHEQHGMPFLPCAQLSPARRACQARVTWQGGGLALPSSLFSSNLHWITPAGLSR